MPNRMWKLTSLGMRRTSDTYAKEASDPILSYMHQLGRNKTASTEELSTVSGKSYSEMTSSLRRYESMGFVGR